MINKQIKAWYEEIMRRGGPKGVITQSIVDEYHRLVKLESEPELETKKIRISFLKKRKTNGKILSISLNKLDDPIFDSPYGIFTPRKFSSKEKDKKKPKDEKLNKKNKVNK